jgi:ABC-type dipeptide/oligopeptide/nickel transport system permease subunit
MAVRSVSSPAALTRRLMRARSTGRDGCAPVAQRRLRSRYSPSLLVGAFLVAMFLLSAAFAPLISTYPPNQVGAGESLVPPTPAHPFGTDLLGRDMLSRVLFGARTALLMAAMGVGLAAGLGIVAGLAAGYYGGSVDQVLSRLMEIWMAFPGLLLALIIVARLGPSLQNAAIALGIVTAPGFYRLTRSTTLCSKHTGYVEAAFSVGAPDRRIILRHILPNIAPSLIVLLSMRFGLMILAGGSLSFIGLGAQPPQAEWGALLANARDYIGQAPWLALYPGLAVTATVVGLNLLGDGLRDLMTPRSTPIYR